MHTCSDCPEKAVCVYDFGAGERYGCRWHDPFAPGKVQTAAGTMTGFTYRTLPDPFVSVTTGHLGIPGIDPAAPIRMNFAAGT